MIGLVFVPTSNLYVGLNLTKSGGHYQMNELLSTLMLLKLFQVPLLSRYQSRENQ